MATEAASRTDIVVIGGGIAGAGAAFELAARARVVLLEREARCGLHATGRSAASFSENYGPPIIRRLAIASRPFLEAPPPGFAANPLMRERGMITIARVDQLDALRNKLRQAAQLSPGITALPVAEVLARVPFLRPGYVAGAMIEPGSREIDVNELHTGFLTGARRRGAFVQTNAEVRSIRRSGQAWEVECAAGAFEAAAIVNAAGAWADVIAGLAGVARLGLVPKRRTAFLIPAPDGVPARGWPLIDDVGDEFYFKPDAGNIFVSPSDATPSEPMDAYPDDLDVAIGVERFERATTMQVKRVLRSWAGLRTFAPDGAPVAGFDAAAPGFFWLAGQGGYGIKTSPALSQLAASLILDGRLPAELTQAGVSESELSPSRFRHA